MAAGVRGLVLDGRLPVGERLPSERDLAAALGVSRNTVGAAYDMLREEGYVRSARGAGSRVAHPGTGPVRPDAPADDRSDVVDLTIAAMPAPRQLLDAVEAASVALGPLLAGHGLHPFGLPVLRVEVARHLTSRGLVTEPEQVLITNGALHGWDLVLRALSSPRDRVLVEQPTYPTVLDAVQAHRLRPLVLPVAASGWSSSVPAGAVLAHVTPDAQNPTGLVASTSQRRELLAALGRTLVVVDETFADLLLDGDQPEPTASLGADVITLGSMSKAFWAGLRVGWVRASPQVLARLVQSRAAQDQAGPVLEQLVAAELLRNAEAVLSDRKAQLRRSRTALLEALATTLPTWRCTSPSGGMVLWVELPTPGATVLAGHALDVGLRVTPGPRFTVDGTADRYLRLPIANPPESAPGIVTLLAEAAARAASGAVPGRRPLRWTA
ncbi:MAG: PLP-dependent aminotransferase family protein [Actinobacteria bacterium]|nr:PLP-dependent aminotransferase family protein [Actinomycetota bacterium]